MKKVGLIGEDPNDTTAIKNLLSKKYTKCHFFPLLRNLKGSHLDNRKALRMFKSEAQTRSCNAILFIRDLDGHENDKAKKDCLQAWFNNLKKEHSGQSIFLLNIHELEALILADIEGFNAIYKTSLKPVGDVMHQTKPKELLMQKTEKCARKYKESDVPEIFSKLDIDKLTSCRYFKTFIDECDAHLK